MTTFVPCKFIAHLPVEERPRPDGEAILTACGVSVWFPGMERGKSSRIPDRLSWKIDDALSAEAQADGVNMPVELHPNVWLHWCRRCQRPFIGLSGAKICSDECRTLAKRDSIRKASAKRGRRRAEASEARTSACRHCGEHLPARRSSKRFCSVKCRVAAHRGAPATYVVEWPDIGETPEAQWFAWGATYTKALDRQIADLRSMLSAAQCGYLDRATLKNVMERGVALQAERAKLVAIGVSTPASQAPSRPNALAAIP
jgi:hypothetical protein